MPARHREEVSSRRLGLSVAIVLVLALLGGVGFWGYQSYLVPDESSAASCDADTPSIVVTPEMLAPAEQAASAMRHDGCEGIEVTAAQSSAVASGVLGDDLPDLWIPDSTAWLGRTAANVPTPTALNASLATSPVVLVSSGETPPPSSWLAAIGSGTVAVTDPLSSSTGAGALLSVQAERAATKATDEQVGGVLVPAAQNYGAQPAPIKDTESALAAVTAPGARVVAVASEQAFLAYVEAHPGVSLNAAVPQTGAVLLDYPLAAFTNDPSVAAAAAQFAQHLTELAGQQALHDASFRDIRGTELGQGVGVGPVQVLVVPRDPKAVESTLHTWAVLTVPSRLLAVFDVSGSMDEAVGSTDRISLTVEAAVRGLAMFSNSAQIGAWAFSDYTLTDGSTPYRGLLPLRGLETEVGASTQRDILRAKLERLPLITTGGTALNDTLLAAYRHMQESYDPNSVNNVVLLTDGAEDGSSQLSEAEVIATLKREFDPKRPVNVILIGISADADVRALKRLSAAVQGRYYVAENPADIGEVFINAFLNRAAG